MCHKKRKSICDYSSVLFAAAYGRGGVLMHSAPVLFHRFQLFEFFIADVTLERSGPARPKEESSHTFLWAD
jgi:hypothetical protein